MSTFRIVSRSLPLQAKHFTRLQTRLASDSVSKSFESKKSAQKDRTQIDRQSYENTNSGTDDAVANIDKVSYERTRSTDPEQAKDVAAEQSGQDNANPLEVSAANPKVSSFSAEDSVGSGGGFVVEEKQTHTKTTIGSASAKKTSTGAPQNKAHAGFDTRQPQHPREVAQKQQTISPRSR